MGEPDTQTKLIESVRARVIEWIPEFAEEFRIQDNGTVTAFHSRMPVSVSVEPLSRERSMVQFRAAILFDVPRSPGLYEWIVDQNNFLRAGCLKAIPSVSNPEEVQIFHVYEILGDALDFEEFKFAFVFAAAAATMSAGDGLASRFGGKSAELPSY